MDNTSKKSAEDIAKREAEANRFGLIVVAIAFLIMGTFIGTLFWSSGRVCFYDGDLVLTETGCAAIRHHGGVVQPVVGEPVCTFSGKVRLQKGILDRAPTLWIRFDDSQSRAIDVFMSDRELVSRSFRGECVE